MPALKLGKLSVFTAKEIAEETPEVPDYIVEGFAVRGSLSEIAAKIKAGKTTFISHLIKSVVNGTPFLDRFDTKQVPVLYLTEERKGTFRKVLERAGLTEREDLYVVHLSDAKGMTWGEIVKNINLGIKALNPGLIIVDTLSRWTKVEDENDSAEAGRIMEELEALVTADVAVISVRHAKKAQADDTVDAARGGSAYGGATDILLLLTRDKGQANRRVIHAETRYDDLPGEMFIDLQEGEYYYAGDSDGKSKSNVRANILGTLGDENETAMTVGEIANELEMSNNTVWKVLQELEKDGLVFSFTLPGKGAPKGYCKVSAPGI